MGSSALQEVGEGIKSRRCQMDYVNTRGKILFSSFTLKKTKLYYCFFVFFGDGDKDAQCKCRSASRIELNENGTKVCFALLNYS